jgi:hypothetical protein
MPKFRNTLLWLTRWVYPCLLSSLWSVQAEPAKVTAGLPQYRLSGTNTLTASSQVCGLVLLTQETRAQVLVTDSPATCVVSLRTKESVEITIPFSGSAGDDLLASATVRGNAGSSAKVALWWNNDAPQDQNLAKGLNRISAQTHATSTNSVLHLRTSGLGADCTVRWEKVRVSIGENGLDVPLSPGGANVDVCPPPILPPLHRALEEALVEWDWRMQDGIGTPRESVSYATAITRTLQRAKSLLQDLTASGVEVSTSERRWQELEKGAEDLNRRDAPEEQWEDLWRETHRARRELVFSNPLAKTGPIAFVKQVSSMFSHQLTQYYGSCARPGGGVFVLESPGQSMACRSLAQDQLPLGSYQHLDISHDGKELMFAYCETSTVPKDRDEHPERFYHLYRVAADGSELRRLTDGSYDDFSPRYLPDGRKLFISTRRGGFHRCGRGPCPVYTLTLADADGSNPHPISYHETHEWDPTVMHDGRILYTRWDYVDRHAVYYQQLWTARPDGSGVAIFYGNNTFNPVGVWEAQSIPGSPRIMATAGAHHAMTAGSIILLDTSRNRDGAEPVTRLTPDALFPESEAPVLMMPNGAWVGAAGPGATPPASPESARWPGHCYRSPYPLSEKYFLAAYSFDPLIGEPTWNRANMFGLYFVDAFGNKELLYRDLNIASLWPMPLRARVQPFQLPDVASSTTPSTGTFFVQNIHASWPELPQEPITRLRIIQVLPKSTPHANTPTVGLPHASPGKQVLGTVPVEADGSAYFTAPARIPLAFQALDDQGLAVQTMRSLTYLQPGEAASCVGCHEGRHDAPRTQGPALALQRAPSSITPGPDGSNPLSYPLLVQPVLDRKCVSCHNPAKPDGNVLLTGEPQGRYTVSYNALAPKVPYSDWAGRPGDFREVNREPLSPPEFFGARGCKLMKQILHDPKGHYEVKLDREELERLVTWMDANVLFYGTFDPADQAKQQAGQRIAGPAIQ